MAAERILIIDDDEDVRDFLCQALQDEGYEVSTAADGLTALELLGQVRPQLILLDALMPMMDGWDFMVARSHHPQQARVPVIALSAVGNAAESLRRVGADDYLAKPFELEDLLALIAKHLRPATGD